MNSQIDITIPAAVGGVPGVVNMSGAGRYFKCLALSAAFEVRFGNSDFKVNNPGDGFGSPNSKQFARLTFYNANAGAVTATVYIGDDPITQATTAISSSVTAQATLANTIANCAEAVPAQILKVGNVANAVALTAGATYFRWCVLIAQKDMAGTANAGNVNIGFAGGAGQQPISLAPGDQYVVPIPTGAKVNFQNVYLAIANAGDGVVALYV